MKYLNRVFIFLLINYIRLCFFGYLHNRIEEIRKLKGIGDYTAAAIASIAFDLPHDVVDGNVYRVLARLYDIDTPINNAKGIKLFAELADELVILIGDRNKKCKLLK